MKKIYLIFALIPTLVFCQNEEKSCESLSKMTEMIQKIHYKPKAVDDSLSVFVFDEFIDELDENHRLFLEPEVAILKEHRFKIDEYIKDKNCAFLTDIFVAYNKSLVRYSAVIEQIKNEPFVYSSKEAIKFSKKNFPFFKTEADLKHFYKKSILFNVLREVAETSKNKDSLVLNFDMISKQSKDKVLDSYACKLSGYQLTKADFNTKFFSIFCSYFDPHTEYFTKSEKSSFMSGVSSDNLSYGLSVSLNEKEEIEVDEIIPGSSAYFTDKIAIGDKIVKINSKNEEYTVACSAMKKIGDIMTSDDYKQADFTLRKKSGITYTVSLSKKVLKDYENNVYSYILENEGKKTGYVKIPSFYATMENGKSNVSDDLVKEIYKLKEDQVDGLIIDLQNNGGGSMNEVIKMAGLFIDAGPLAILDDSEGKKETIKDPNRGTIYSGPMVVLINGLSASASEFFANAMQDYNRAVVIGNQSYGKASMQQIFPLDNKRDAEEFVKITTEKFYRITGTSNQTNGITPDVAIDSAFDKQIPREKSNKTALKSDIIASNLRFDLIRNPKRDFAIENSKKRVGESLNIKAVSDLNVEINKLYDNDLPDILLDFNSVFSSVSKVNLLWKATENLSKKEFPLAVIRNSVDIEYQQFDEFLKKSNEDKIKSIKSNLAIIEAVNIINDLKN